MFTPAATSLPDGLDLDSVLSELRDDHVAAPAKDEAGLAKIVTQARADGIDLSIVVVTKNPWHDSQLRDLATEVGKSEGGTVLVLSPDWAGTYSTTLTRVKLEAGEDQAKYTAGQYTTAANNFVAELEQPELPWTALTSVVFVGMLATIGGLYFVKQRRAERELTTADVPVEHR